MLVKRAHGMRNHVVVQGLGRDDKEAHSFVGNACAADGVVRDELQDRVVRFGKRSLDSSLKARVVVAHGVYGV